MSDEPGNQTPNTPNVSGLDLRDIKVDELRQEAKDKTSAGLPACARRNWCRKLPMPVPRAGTTTTPVLTLTIRRRPGGRKDPARRRLIQLAEVFAGGHLPEDKPEREGRSLATTHHEVIRQWAEEHGGTPATVEGTEHGDHLGVLRIRFGLQRQQSAPRQLGGMVQDV